MKYYGSRKGVLAQAIYMGDWHLRVYTVYKAVNSYSIGRK
jgi:hypothetical protein